MKQFMALAFAGLILSGPIALAGYEDDDTPGQWVCFAHDYQDGVSKSEAETSTCVRAYHRGSGICMSHAKAAAVERCLSYSTNKATCKVNKESDCYRLEEK